MSYVLGIISNLFSSNPQTFFFFSSETDNRPAVFSPLAQLFAYELTPVFIPCWNRLKGDVCETSQRQGGAHMGFSERIDTILN